MSQRNWIAALAFGLTVLSGTVVGQEVTRPIDDAERPGVVDQPDNPTESERSEDYGASKQGNFCGPSYTLNCGYRNQPPAQERDPEAEQREKEDLVAQQSMARSTEGMAFWTIVMAGIAFLSTILSAIAVAFVYCTLREARRTTKAALLSVSVARRTNSITKAAFEADQRPWVGLRVRLSNVRLASVKHERYGFDYEISFENFGKSAAKEFSLYALAGTMGSIDHLIQQCRERTERDDLKRGRRTILPGEVETVPYRIAFPKSEMAVQDVDGRQRFVPAIAIGCRYSGQAPGERYMTFRAFIMHNEKPGESDKGIFLDEMPREEWDFVPVPRGESIAT